MAEFNGATEEHPVYRKLQQTGTGKTVLFLVVCDEGWRESIVCENMYGWVADWLINQIQGKPFTREDS